MGKSNKVMQLQGPSQATKMLEKLINHKLNFLGYASTYFYEKESK